MTNRLDALRALEEAVADGSIQPHDLDAFIPVFGLTSKANDALDAYRGSLDAAKSLHDAMLPGWEFAVGKSNAKVVPYNDTADVAGKYGMADNPARAWLLAIIRAMIAKEEAKCPTPTE